MLRYEHSVGLDTQLSPPNRLLWGSRDFEIVTTVMKAKEIIMVIPDYLAGVVKKAVMADNLEIRGWAEDENLRKKKSTPWSLEIDNQWDSTVPRPPTLVSS
jgi:hypothetical protein